MSTMSCHGAVQCLHVSPALCCGMAQCPPISPASCCGVAWCPPMSPALYRGMVAVAAHITHNCVMAQPTPSCHGDTPVPAVMVSHPFSSFFVSHVLSTDLTPPMPTTATLQPIAATVCRFFLFFVCFLFHSFGFRIHSQAHIPMPTPLISTPTGKSLLLSQPPPPCQPVEMPATHDQGTTQYMAV